MKKQILAFFTVLTLLSVAFFSLSRMKDPDPTHVSGEPGPKPEFPGEAMAYWEGRLKTPEGENPAFLNLKAKQQITAKRQNAGSSTLAFNIESFGPGNFGGRVRSILVHSQNPERILTAGVSGGVWGSEDAGQTWEPQSDFLSSIAISCMANNPDNPNEVFLGTGEGFFGWGMARGLGVFRSMDFGKTWTQMESTVGQDFYYVNRLAVLQGTGTVLAATRTGIFRSVDHGVSWVKVSSQTTFNRGFVDLKADPSNAAVVLASHYGYQSGSSGEYSVLRVNSPSELSGDLDSGVAAFGPSLSSTGPVTGDLVVYVDQDGTNSIGCTPPSNALELNGKIALIDRGSCPFVDKVKNAQNAGAIAVVIANTEDAVITMGGTDGTITIPSLMISKSNGDTLKAAMASGVNVTLLHEISSDPGSFITRSTDGGQTFQKLTAAEGLPQENVSRMEIGWGTDGVVYISISNDLNQTLGLWRSSDHGQTYAKTASTTAFIERQGWYDLMVGVDPSDSDRIYLGAVDIYRSVNAGATIEKITVWNPAAGEVPQYVHADIHAVAFHPNHPQTLFIGCDGGVYQSENGGDSFSSLNNDLRIVQNYGLAVHPDGTRVITGTQDNGSHLFFGDKDVWLEWYGGDGGICAWDKQDPNYIYGSLPEGELFGSKTMGSSSSVMNLPDTDGALFIQPFVLDPNDGNRLMVGTDNVFLTTEARLTRLADWTDVSGPIGTVYALAFDPFNRETAYAANNAGGLYRTTHLSSGTTFDLIASFSGLVTSIAFDPADSTGDTMFISLTDYRADRVLRTTNGGLDWVSIHGNLPSIPVHDLVMDPVVAGRIFLGTELGLFVGQPSGETYHWELLDYGIAWTRVVKMEWGNENQLWIATHGRGTYRLSRNPVEISSSNFQVSGDGDRFLDKGENHTIQLQLKNATPSDLGPVTVMLENHTSGVIVQPASRTTLLVGDEIALVDFMVELDQVHPLPLDILISGSIEIQGFTHEFSIPLTLCGNPNEFEGTFQYDAETIEPMESQSEIGTSPWVIDSTRSHAGGGALFAVGDGPYSLKSVTSPAFQLVGPQPQLSFWLSYDLQGTEAQYREGLVLDAQIDEGEWFDIGHLASGAPYDGQLHTDNALYLRNAWSGSHDEWRQATVDLSAFSGRNFRFRFRLGSNRLFANFNGGAWIDDVQVEGAAWDESPEPDTQVCTSCTISPSEKAYLYYLPYVSAENDSDSIVTIINAWSESSVEVELIGFDKSGKPLTRYAQTLPASGALVKELSVLFPNQAVNVHWVQIGADSAIEAMTDVVSSETRSAYLASYGVDSSLFVPHIAKNTASFETHLITVNGSPENGAISFLDNLGTSFGIESEFKGWNQSHILARDLLGDQVTTTDWGRLTATAPNTAAMEFFTNPEQSTRIASLGLNRESGTQLRFLHLAADTNLFWTGMVYFNSSQEALHASESYFSAAGELLSEKQVDLGAGEKQTVLFDHTTQPESVPAGSSWMEVNGDQPMVGYELFGSSSLSQNDYFAGLQGSYSQGRSLVFQVFFATESAWTGLVLINVGEESSALLLQAYDVNGNLLESMPTEAIGPKSKALLLGANLFSESTRNQTAWVKAVANGSLWDGFSLWGDHGTVVRKYLAGVRAAVHP